MTNREEPSLLDYIKSVFRGKPLALPPAEEASASQFATDERPAGVRPEDEALRPPPAVLPASSASAAHPSPVPGAPVSPAQPAGAPEFFPTPEPEPVSPTAFPWRSLVALALALVAQITLEPPTRTALTSGVIYLLSAAFLVWAYVGGEWMIAPLLKDERLKDDYAVRRVSLIGGASVLILAYLAFSENLFTPFNLILWGLGLANLMYGLWLPGQSDGNTLARLRAFVRRPNRYLRVTPWNMLVLAALALVTFFHFYRLGDIPPEMISDHAEKLLDVVDVLDGQFRIFFPRNTGREPIYIYLSAAIAKYLGTGITYLTIKLSATIGFMLMLPYVYLLGKELGSRRIGLLAVIFVGIAYWPNIFSRFALRISFYPLFVAPTMYYLVRGLRRSNRNELMMAGLALGFGLMGYTPFRIMPIIVVIAVGIYLLHRQAEGVRSQTIWGFVLLVAFSFVAFLPLLRYLVDHPNLVAYRTLTRVSSVEAQIVGSAWKVFFQNLWNSMTMFSWSNGQIWVHSIPFRPAVDIVSGALFHLGMLLLFVRYIRKRHWLDLFMLLSVPLLMMPSILSLAFPAENPSLNRSAGAIVPVFLIVGVALDGLLTTLQAKASRRWGAHFAWVVGLALVFWSSSHNYDLVFNQYVDRYRLSSWNTSEIGEVIGSYARSFGRPDSAWVVGYPHWADTRLVAINAGYPQRDYAIWPDEFEETLSVPPPKLFIINPNDHPAVELLYQHYPQGMLRLYDSEVETKDFWLFLVTADGSAGALPAVPETEPMLATPYP